MGQVFRARDTKLDRDVAIKILPEAFAHDADRLARFQREAKTLASLNHPHIAGIYGLEESGGMTALVMELVEGDDLSQRIARGAIPLDEALPIAKQIAAALEAAHEQGIIHRDLKPANIKVRADGTVKVLDFGLAKAMDPAGTAASSFSMSPTITTPAMTQAGMILGTAAYMSPEQARGRPMDKRADIWALGCVLFEMLSGSRAFGGELVPDVMAGVLKSEPNYALLPSTTPPRLRSLLQRCLQKDPRNRWRDVGDVRIELESVDKPVVEADRSRMLSAGRSRWGERVLWLGGLLAALLVAWLLRAPSGSGDVRSSSDAHTGVLRFTLSPPEGSSLYTVGWIVPLALSPDARWLAFTATSVDGRSRLWLRPMGSDAAQPVQGTEHARTPFWSPDSQWLGFEARNTWYRVRVPNGVPESISTSRFFTGGSWGAAWGDDVILFVGPAGAILRASVQGGQASPLTTVDPSASERGHSSPQFLSDGRRFLYVAVGQPSRVYLESINGGRRTHVMDMPGGPSTIRYVPGTLFYVEDMVVWAHPFDEASGHLHGNRQRVLGGVPVSGGAGAAAFSVSHTGVLALWPQALIQQAAQLQWMDRTGRRVGLVGPPTVYDGFNLSRDDARVAWAQVGREGLELWIRDLASGSSFPLKSKTRGTVPVWTPDGRKLVFLNTGSGTLSLGDASGGQVEAVKLTDRTRNQLAQDWTADGEQLIYENWDADTGIDLMVLQVTPKRSDRLAWNTSANEFGARLAPGDQWLAYVTDQTGRNEVWVTAFPSGQPQRQISSAGGSHPAWKGDGTELFFISAEGQLVSVPFRTAASRIDVGTATNLFRIPGTIDITAGSHNMYTPSRDGQRFLVAVKSEVADVPPISVIVNWPRLLTEGK